MLISKTVLVKWSKRTKKWYIDKGYKFTKMGEEFEVEVEDLSDSSGVKVNVKCDCKDCKSPILKPMTWVNYKKYIHDNGEYICRNCSNNIPILKQKRNKTKLLKSESFYDWCYENLSKQQANEIIERWDEKLNVCSPKDIGFGSKGVNEQGYYFKCLIHTKHKSELKNISSFVHNFNKYGNSNELDCKMCNSFAQWGIDNYGQDFLEKYWDYERNNKLGLDPWKISSGNGIKKVWIKCQEKDYHKSYSVSCSSFTNMNTRCPLCCNFHGKVHKYDSLGWLYPQVFDIWSEKNEKSPYEYAPMSSKEVWWKCPDGKHEDYLRKVGNSNQVEFRCPECVQEMDKSIIENKTKLYLESLGYEVLHENKCTLVPINPKTKYQLPFDNEIKLINGKMLICEVNGIQHYQELCGKWFNENFDLHKRKLYDRYKRFISFIKGYEYLELPYTVFDDKNTYKKLIDDKINQILNKN